ncbi:MAG: nucleoside hydrolase [Verrucomicrobia bacterium]|nr:nucleoside hydrolase [Verrucomicrobiota bacterium]
MKTRRRFLLSTTALTLVALTMFLQANPAPAAERVVPQLPPPGERVRLLIDTDAACEIDDLYAIALALASQDRFKIEGFVAAHFGDAGGPRGIEKSVAAVHALLEKAGLAGRFPVKRGAPPFQYSTVPVEADGVDFIIERALAADEKAPLWIVSLGACTDVASAWLKRPEIARRVVVLWHGRTQFWPEKCWNFNVYNDLKAVRLLFTSDLPLMLFDTGTDLTCPMAESEQRLQPQGALGKYLHEFRLRNAWFQSPTKGFFDLGDIAVLLDASLAKWEIVPAPNVNWDMLYEPGQGRGRIVRIHSIARDGTFELFYRKMAVAFPSSPGKLNQ